jgi:hypothetical protein
MASLKGELLMPKSLQQKITQIVININDNHLQFRDGKIKSVPHSDKRCALLVEGLNNLAEHFNFPAVIRYESTGEYTFNGNKGRHPEDACSPFGEELAAWLSTIPTRTGTQASKGHVMAQNGWTRINHFDAEKLLNNIAQFSDPADA